MFVVYRHTNQITGKTYVGYTGDEHDSDAHHLMIVRWHEHCYIASCKRQRVSNTYFHRALRKHGVDCWEHVVIDVFNNRASAASNEILWISILHTYENGYNMTRGGDGIFVDWTPEKRREHSVLTKRSMEDPIIRKKMIDGLKLVGGTPEGREKNKQAQLLAQNRSSVIEKRELRNSLDATKKTRREKALLWRTDPVKVSNHLNGVIIANNKRVYRTVLSDVPIKRAVQQIDNNENIVNTFHTISFAVKSTNVPRSAILRSLKKNVYVYGFCWRYVT